MSRGFLHALSTCTAGILAILTVSAGITAAADPPAKEQPVAPPAGLTTPPMTALPLDTTPAAPRTPRMWLSIEELLWWIKDGPNPVPEVTTSNTNDEGIIGRPTTQVLFGGSPLDYGAFNGMRLSGGGWLNSDATLGIQGSGFLLERRSTGIILNSPGTPGSPLFAVPESVANTGQQTSLVLTQPGVAFPGVTVSFPGGIAISSSTRLWGAEVNGVASLIRGPAFALRLLAGYRFLDLRESLDLTAENDTHVAVGPVLVDVTNTSNDAFQTHNQFHGGQLGAELEYRRNRWALLFAAKVALGTTHEVLDVRGSSTATTFVGIGGQTFVNTTTTTPGGIFTGNTNIGRTVHNEFGVVPEAQFDLSYDLRPNLRAWVGYTFLCWSSVIRPGNQLSQPVINPDPPPPLFNRSVFWAQGISFGLGLRF
ncbi:hypothetical protein AYO44_15985 [Planctomycetaceae bacterium SCGC AG-212-F19]|nr:hypothetical protein AYO44_15985 [Planctomycetaceae bacterium SCGC AG-212-F19]